MFAGKPNNISMDKHIPIIQLHAVEKIKIKSNRDLLTLLPCHPYASGGGSGMWSIVKEPKIRRINTMKKVICIILAAAAAMTFIVSRRPRPRGRREI